MRSPAGSWPQPYWWRDATHVAIPLSVMMRSTAVLRPLKQASARKREGSGSRAKLVRQGLDVGDAVGVIVHGHMKEVEPRREPRQGSLRVSAKPAWMRLPPPRGMRLSFLMLGGPARRDEHAS